MLSPPCPWWRDAIFANVDVRKAVRKLDSGESLSEGSEIMELNFPDHSQWFVVMSRGNSVTLSCRERRAG
jgi:hypothetical protein